MYDEKSIGLIAAVSEEISPLLKHFSQFDTMKSGGRRLYRFSRNNRTFWLIQSGMGLENAAAATQALITEAAPSVILNFGFCGAVSPAPKVGDLVFASRILYRHGRLFSEQPGIVPTSIPEILSEIAKGQSFNIYEGTFISTQQITSKTEIATQLPTGAVHPVLEMETAAIARVAAQHKVPFVALRAISDDAYEELGFSITELTDRNLNVRLWKVLLTLGRKPWLLPQFIRLGRNSRRAGKYLTLAINMLLDKL